MLRRIEHAARNTAAAPFCRRSSLEWPCKIWILLLSIGRLCCIFGVCWGVLVTILGALGAHFGSQNRSFWVPGGASWVPKRFPGPPQARYPSTSAAVSVVRLHFWDHFGIIFLWIFCLFFGPLFGLLLERFWSNFGSQNGAKIIKKSIQNSIEFLVGFLIGSWTVFGRFWERFGDLGPSKMSVSLKRGAIFEKITFFRPDSVLDGFLMDFGWFWEPFWGPF